MVETDYETERHVRSLLFRWNLAYQKIRPWANMLSSLNIFWNVFHTLWSQRTSRWTSATWKSPSCRNFLGKDFMTLCQKLFFYKTAKTCWEISRHKPKQSCTKISSSAMAAKIGHSFPGRNDPDGSVENVKCLIYVNKWILLYDTYHSQR